MRPPGQPETTAHAPAPHRGTSCAVASRATPRANVIRHHYAHSKPRRTVDTAIGDKRGQQVKCLLYGQEINAETYAICKSDLYIKSADGRDAEAQLCLPALLVLGVMLALRVAESLGQADPESPLAIASCGNSALFAAVVAVEVTPEAGGEAMEFEGLARETETRLTYGIGSYLLPLDR